MKDAVRYIISQLLAGRSDLEKIKSEASRSFPLKTFPRNSEILAAFPKDKLTTRILSLLRKRPMRTQSGVTPVAIMVKPEGSCKWSCIYCPYTGKAPKSYTGEEPAALRARQSNFNPAVQVRTRLRHYRETGHPTGKCELIVMGGSFLSMPLPYRRSFIKSAYEAFNGRRAPSLASAKRANETARNRVVGLTMETRPDLCGKKEIREMLGYGATRVELGVQHPDDTIYKKINRGHGVKEVVLATSLLKDSAFKVCYHIMPGLPGSDEKKDVQMFKKLFSDPRFRPDMLKIYPTLVMPNTPLYEIWKRGEYEPYSAEKAAKVIAEAYRYIPPYVRVMRIQRDIPLPQIGAGVRHSNLRELVEKEAGPIREIRAREVKDADFSPEDAELKRIDYAASGGKEAFLSYETGGKLIGFLRLRIPRNPFLKEITRRTALVRELHVYGSEAPVGGKGNAQHRNFGSLLLNEAERIAKEEFSARKMLIISGVGVRRYYMARGYSRDGPYVSMKL
ncbi:MAG: tRNA uridine(34) 5-carboxymethylaminomethyl modification radical SAM/GNAT enzyme Elp3 [Candidatus Micrarchaeia archaeon]|jgi:elongator complex protein 3